MRTTSLLLLLAIGLLVPSNGDEYSSGSSTLKQFFYRHFFTDNSASEQTRVPNFQEGTEYHYSYDAQVESGLSTVDESGTKTQTTDNGQQSVTRMQSQVKVYFVSQRLAQLCMTENRFGQLNEQMKQMDSQQCYEPLESFEPKQLPQEKREKLELCCQFDYVDGVIARIQFDKNDETWSKNIKRGVLNMIQMNLRQNNAQELEGGNSRQQLNNQMEEMMRGQQMRDELAHSFTIPEVTVEGECMTSYTINTAKPSEHCSQMGMDESNKQQQMPCSFNVTKSINFKQCSRIGDLSSGFQTEQQQSRCNQCMMDWYKRDETNQQQSATAEHPCAKCDPKVVNEQNLDRQTVMRTMLKCGNEQWTPEGQQQQECPNCCQINNSEMRSMYVFKNTKTESGPYGSVMRTEVCANLQLRSVQIMENRVLPTQTSDSDESLLYSNQLEAECHRFYMFGDEEFPDSRSSPYSQVPKVEQAGQALRVLVHSTLNHHQGVDTKQTMKLSRLVEMLRMCSYEDLKQIEQNARQNDNNQEEEEKQQTAKHILVDAMAVCGTFNCVVRLAEIIKNQELPQHKAAYTISQLTGLPAPSNSIVNEVQKLCQSEQVQNQPMVKQSACFTFGALVNELCQQKSQKTPDASRIIQEQCTENMKEQYKQVLVEQYEQATNLQEKLNALTALGNAGIDSATPQLEQIIKDTNEHSLCRAKAIDALRRQSTQQPRTVQHIILPIYLNNQEDPNVRIVALQVLMRTQPEPSVIDQIIYTMSQEPNKRVRAYTYQTMKLVAKSVNPADRQMSKHVKNALQLANVDEQQLWNYGKWQIPVYSPEQEEGIFLTLATEYPQRSWIPGLSYLKIDSYFKEQSNVNDLTFYVMKTQQQQMFNQNRKRRTTHKYERNDENTQKIQNIFNQLGIKSRHSSPRGYYYNTRTEQEYNNNNNNINVFCIRIGDIDNSCYEIQQQTQQQQSFMPTLPPLFTEFIQSIQNGRKPNLARMFSELVKIENVNNNNNKYTIAGIFNEKQAVIPTSVGLPLGILNSVPMLLNVKGNVNLQLQKNMEEMTKVQINGHLMAGMAHIQKMRCWTPFLVSGVKSIRSIEINVPIQMDINANTNNEKQSLILNVKLPKEKIRLFGAHSHPYVYTADMNSENSMIIEPRQIKTIRNPKMDRLQHQMNILIGEKNLGIPVNVHAHYHWPTSSSVNFEQICKMLMSTENAIHVNYQIREEQQQQQEYSKEIVFRMNLESFQPFGGEELKMKMNDFYLNKFENNQEENEEEEEENNNNKRQQKMSTFLSKYQQTLKQQKHYKHRLEMFVQTIGGLKEFKFQTELQAKCEEKMQICQIEMQAQKSLTTKTTNNNNNNNEWLLKGQSVMVMPENNDENNDENKNNQYSCKTNLIWGNNEYKEQINVRINGEQQQQFNNNNNNWKQFLQNNLRLKRRISFINKFNFEIKYLNLKPITRNIFERSLELIKSKYFWNTKTQLIERNEQKEEINNRRNGMIYLNILIDPITQKHSNITIKTPEQLVYLQQIELPMQINPFPLWQHQNAQNIQSFDQYLSHQEVKSRAECSVNGQTVKTFDEREYSSPLSTNCYSVLAKDCGVNENQVPQFVVLMKSNKNGQKKLKIIEPKLFIECQREEEEEEEQIKCKINGQQQQYLNNNNQLIQYNNNQKNDLIINLDKLSVRFNGYKVWIKISSIYKNTQCGLCGHYDDASNDENELIMANNKIATNFAQFHRSYSLSNNYDNDDKLCNSQELDKFYQENFNKFGNLNEEEEEEMEENKLLNNKNWDEERFDGNYDQNKENKYFNERLHQQEEEEEEEWNNIYENNEQQKRTTNERNWRRKLEPILKTNIIEMENDICFSKIPIKHCPMGTYPTGWNNKYENEEEKEEKEENNKYYFTTKNVPYICLPRSDSETRHLLYQYNNNKMRNEGRNNKQQQQQQLLDLNNYNKQQTFVEKVYEPTNCSSNKQTYKPRGRKFTP